MGRRESHHATPQQLAARPRRKQGKSPPHPPGPRAQRQQARWARFSIGPAPVRTAGPRGHDAAVAARGRGTSLGVAEGKHPCSSPSEPRHASHTRAGTRGRRRTSRAHSPLPSERLRPPERMTCIAPQGESRRATPLGLRVSGRCSRRPGYRRRSLVWKPRWSATANPGSHTAQARGPGTPGCLWGSRLAPAIGPADERRICAARANISGRAGCP